MLSIEVTYSGEILIRVDFPVLLGDHRSEGDAHQQEAYQSYAKSHLDDVFGSEQGLNTSLPLSHELGDDNCQLNPYT